MVYFKQRFSNIPPTEPLYVYRINACKFLNRNKRKINNNNFCLTFLIKCAYFCNITFNL